MSFIKTTDSKQFGASIKLPNYFVVTADMSNATWNTIASHEIATTIGMVHYIIIPQCTSSLTDVANGASIQFGIEGSTNALIASTSASGATSATAIKTNDLWVDATPADTVITKTTQINGLDFVVGGGLDVGYEITGAVLTGGTMLFHVWWESLDTTGSVIAGAGGSL